MGAGLILFACAVVGFAIGARFPAAARRVLRARRASAEQGGTSERAVRGASGLSHGERRAMIEHAPVAVALFDREMRYVACSDRWLSDYALEREAILGRSHYEIFPEIGDPWKQIHARCMAGAIERCEEDLFERADGSRQFLRWEVRPWFEAGAIGGIAMYTEDISERVELERARAESDAWLRGVLDASISTGIVTTDLRGIVTLFNPGAERQLGYRAEEIVGRTTPEIWHVRDETEAFASEMAARLGERSEGLENPAHAEHKVALASREWTFRRKDGTTYPVSLHTSVVRGPAGAPVGYLGVFDDISAQRAEQQRLRDHADALEEAKQAALAAARAKSDFLANMSHEIRTPMTAILGFADCLLEDELPIDEQRELLQTIRRNGHFLLDIINNILDLSKIEAGQMAIERECVAPVEVVTDVIALLRVRAQAKGLELRTDVAVGVPGIVYTDSVRLRQILVNLVGNAIKFTASGHVTVRLAASTARDGAAALRVDVIDTGIGLSQSQRANLFEPFSQADASTTRVYGGTGLGLALSQRLARLLGGQIDLESSPGEGSCFTLEIPTRVDACMRSDCVELRAAERHDEPAEIAGDSLSGLRILLAEDGRDNQRLIVRVLSRAGAEVEVVENGREALTRALDAAFDAIVMDMQMPVMDGYEATRALRDAGLDVPILALTAHALAGDRERCLAAGCSDYCTKPIQRRELCDKLRAHVDEHRKRSEEPPSEG